MEETVYDKQIEELKELASDPTLQSCCQRDLEDQIRVAHYKALLTPQDRSQARQRLSRQVFSVDNINQKGDDEPAYDGTDDEPELEALRELRLQELQKQVKTRQVLQSEGHGSLTTVSEKGIMPQSIPSHFAQDTVETSVSNHVVCHFCIQGDASADRVDQFLELLASKYLGTRFLRCSLASTSSLYKKYGLNTLAGIVCFFKGVVTGVLSFHGEGAQGDDGIDEDFIELWLNTRQFLMTIDDETHTSTASTGYISNRKYIQQQHDDHSDDDEEWGNDEWSMPCQECGRRYPHQHIRSMYKGNLNESDDDDD